MRTEVRVRLQPTSLCLTEIMLRPAGMLVEVPGASFMLKEPKGRAADLAAGPMMMRPDGGDGKSFFNKRQCTLRFGFKMPCLVR